jgi:transcriptional regulator with XRE-family HTH domain
MVTMAQRIGELRTKRGLSRPALSEALGFPKTAIEKFETGRQTPSQDQQKKLAEFFGVTLACLRGEDRGPSEDWMDGAFLDTEPAPAPRVRPEAPPAAGESGTMFDAFFSSRKFQERLQSAILTALESPDGRKLLEKAVRGAMTKKP